MKKILHLFVCTIFVCISTWAQPQKFNYQGVARNNEGNPLSNQDLKLRISILNNSSTGAVLYRETHSVTTNAYGLYNIAIGDGTVVDGAMNTIDWSSGNKFIKVEMDPTGGSTFVHLGTNQLLSVPYALQALNGVPGPAGPEGPAGPTGPPGSANISGTTNRIIKFTGATTGGNSQITDNGTTVGINSTSPSANTKLEVIASSINNSIRARLGTAPTTTMTEAGAIKGISKSDHGIIGVSDNGNGVYGVSSGSKAGVYGESTGSGRAIWGKANGSGIAGFFNGGTNGKGLIVSNGPSGIGTTTPKGRLEVIQPTTTVTKIDTFPAIYGYSNTAQSSLKGGIHGTYNGAFEGTGVQGIGFEGLEYSNFRSTYDIYSPLHIGLYGTAKNYGILGVSNSGIGIVGYNKNSTYAATSGFGHVYGMFGSALSFPGMATPTNRYGVYGSASGASTNNFSGYFTGKVHVTGTLSKGSGTFKIDHPLDPENKYLYHSFVESPDMMNIYNGNITTNNEGYATVTLPEYFDALNKDFRYQLTVIGTFAQAIVSEEISGNKFVIQTNQPNVKVSWQVTGVRADKFAEANRVIPEVEKEAEFKGLYLHAEEYGQPEEKSIDFHTRPKDMNYNEGQSQNK